MAKDIQITLKPDEWTYYHPNNSYYLGVPVDAAAELKGSFPGDYSRAELNFEFGPKLDSAAYMLQARVPALENQAGHTATAYFDPTSGETSYRGKLELLQALVHHIREAKEMPPSKQGGLDVLLSVIESGEIRRE